MDGKEYCIYLRKSRADMDAEAHGEGETLARHEKALLELAKRERLNITQIHREIVSGDTIAARPVMQQLLQEVQAGQWAGVLVMEVERLARGETIDQGYVAQAFQYSDTKIITPLKTYDPTNEYDEEYFEFGLFMSRREYKTIKRRLMRGREAASKEGKWVGGSCPYGYERVRVESGKGWTLKVVPDEAEVVKLIFQLYTQGQPLPDGTRRDVGTTPICRALENRGIPAPSGGRDWRTRTIDLILQNPAYIGKIRWNRRKTKRKVEDGRIKPERYISEPDNWILVDGLHEAIIDPATFQQAADKLARRGPAPVQFNGTLKNPFSGIAVCEKCGRALALWTNAKKYSMMKCRNRFCDNVSVSYELFEARVFEALAGWVRGYNLDWTVDADSGDELLTLAKQAYAQATKALENREKQLTRAQEMLEMDVYDVDTFLDRSRALAGQIAAAKRDKEAAAVALANAERAAEGRKNLIPKVEKLLDVYAELPDAAAKNEMLKEILEKITYRRDKRTGPKDDFQITLYPKLPQAGGVDPPD